MPTRLVIHYNADSGNVIGGFLAAPRQRATHIPLNEYMLPQEVVAYLLEHPETPRVPVKV